MKSHVNSDSLNANINSNSSCISETIGKVNRQGNNSKKTSYRLESTVKASHLYSNTPRPSRNSASRSLLSELEPTETRLTERETKKKKKQTRQPSKQLFNSQEIRESVSTSEPASVTRKNLDISRNKLSSLHNINKLHSVPIESIVNVNDFTSIDEWNAKVNQEFDSIYQNLCSAPFQSSSLNDKSLVSEKQSTEGEESVNKSHITKQVINESIDCVNQDQVNSQVHNIIDNSTLDSQMNREDMRNFNRSPQPWNSGETYEYKSQSSMVSKQKTLKSTNNPGNVSMKQGKEVTWSPVQETNNSSYQVNSSKSPAPPVPPKPIMWPTSQRNESIRQQAPPSPSQQQQIPSVIITDVTNKSKIEKIDTIEKTEQLFDENFNQVYSEAVNLADSPALSRRGN